MNGLKEGLFVGKGFGDWEESSLEVQYKNDRIEGKGIIKEVNMKTEEHYVWDGWEKAGFKNGVLYEGKFTGRGLKWENIKIEYKFGIG